MRINNMIMLLLLSLFISSSIAYSFLQNTEQVVAPGKINVTLYGNMGEGRKVMPSLPVTLIMYESSGPHGHPLEKKRMKKNADGEGQAVFRGLGISPSFFYQAIAEYKGHSFPSAVMTFKGTDQIKEAIDIFQASASDDPVRIVQKHVICKKINNEQQDRISFTEFLILTNESDTAFFPEKGKGLKIALPKEAVNVNFSMGVSPSDISYKEGSDHFVAALPVLPGHSNMLNIGYSYEVNFPGEFRYVETNRYPVDSAVWLVSDEDIRIEGAKRAAHGSKSMGENTFYQYTIRALKRGEGIELRIFEDRAMPAMSNIVVIVLIVGIILFALFASFKWRKKSESA